MFKNRRAGALGCMSEFRRCVNSLIRPDPSSALIYSLILADPLLLLLSSFTGGSLPRVWTPSRWPGWFVCAAGCGRTAALEDLACFLHCLSGGKHPLCGLDCRRPESSKTPRTAACAAMSRAGSFHRFSSTCFSAARPASGSASQGTRAKARAAWTWARACGRCCGPSDWARSCQISPVAGGALSRAY